MLKLEHFQYVIEIARTGSISRAAEALYVSQPYLSMSLKELERELGVQLLARNNKGVRLTEAGTRFLDLARQVTDLVGRAKGLSREPP